MKHIALLLIAITLLFSTNILSQNEPKNDLKSIDNIISALYEVISGNKGVERDWDRFRTLFTPEARLIPSSKNKDGEIGYRILSPDDYINTAGASLVENGFHEVEIHRVTEQYGSLLHLWSTYESYKNKTDKEPFMRGINSIQMINMNGEWKVLQIYWLGESDDNILPQQYLPK
ncbi:MAG: hypothetical protein V3V00_03970 [Saprospiraceae bacterium]